MQAQSLVRGLRSHLLHSIFYAEYLMRNFGLEEAQAGIKIARRNINNLRYANITPLESQMSVTQRKVLLNYHLAS